MSAVYVLHFDPPLQHARHYVGWTDHEDVASRLEEHLKGHVFVGADRRFERRIKNNKDVCRWCRICGRNERPRPRILKENRDG